jgi:hypothetical protein
MTMLKGLHQMGSKKAHTKLVIEAFRTVISKIQALDSLAGRCPQSPQPLGHPGFGMDKAVIIPGQNRAEPNRGHPAQAEILPVAMSGKMVVDPRRQIHPLHLLEQKRQIVGTFCDDALDVVHTHSLMQSLIYLQIWANREI